MIQQELSLAGGGRKSQSLKIFCAIAIHPSIYLKDVPKTKWDFMVKEVQLMNSDFLWEGGIFQSLSIITHLFFGSLLSLVTGR